ncbi:MAG: ParB/RepB/Spo0J family partition protein [Planctomycetota bacterium]|nr:ParB/RepB/Spo0J family partition protein [Planctomycetota bacterium]
MAGTRSTLASIESNLLESMGSRADTRLSRPVVAPHPQDIGRRPLPGFGTLAVDQLIPDPAQPRTDFSPEALGRLADSIREQGQLAPIRVRWSDELGKWVIIAGERRWQAAKLAGLPTIECCFQTRELSPSKVLEQQLIENLLREDLKPIEQARAFASLMRLNGWNGKQVAERLRVPASQVSRALALLRLPEDLQQRVDDGEIPTRAAYELSKLDNEGQQRLLADQLTRGNLTHGEAARLVRQRRGRRRDTPRHTKLCFPTEAGWKVVVSAQRKGTYDEIEQALEEALAEVRHRIQNNVQLF